MTVHANVETNAGTDLGDGRAVAVEACRSCRETGLVNVLDLGEQPASDYFPPSTDPGPDPKWPLGLLLCRTCGLVQLDHVSPAPEPPRAVESATMIKHADEVAGRVLERAGLGSGGTVREFASHHGGSWIGGLRRRGCTVEPNDPAQLVIDNHSLIHDEDLASAVAERVSALSTDGVLAIEFHHILEQVDGAQFDTVRHGHPVYLSLHAWQYACAQQGLSLVDVWQEPVYGGCLVALARRGRREASDSVRSILALEQAANLMSADGYTEVQSRMSQVCHDLREYLQTARDEQRKVLAYGAGSKSCTLLGVSGITQELLPLVADQSPAKHNRRIPGAAIPIVSPEELVAAAPDEVLVLTWDIGIEVKSQLREMGLDSRYVVPVPRITEI